MYAILTFFHDEHIDGPIFCDNYTEASDKAEEFAKKCDHEVTVEIYEFKRALPSKADIQRYHEDLKHNPFQEAI